MKMRNPYSEKGGARNKGYDVTRDLEGFSTASGKASESDILCQTEMALDSHDYVAVITRDGRILPRNQAIREGEKDPTALYKKRVWGDH